MTLQRFSRFVLSFVLLRLRSPQPHLWLSLLVSVVMLSTAGVGRVAAQTEAVELRVAIEEDISEVKIGSSTNAVVHDGAGRKLGEIAAMHAFFAHTVDGKVALDRWQARQLWIEPSDGGFVYIGDRWYRGRTLVVPTAKGLTAVNYVDLEQYLYSVLGGEMNGNWPPEALKAQAVAARSYALYHRQRSGNSVYDVGDTPGWQVYRGLVDEAPGTQVAVNATSGQVLINSGEIIEAVFHSSAGGCTDNVEEVWVQPLPYLRSVKENFKERSPVAEWSVAVTGSDLGSVFSGVGPVSSIEILDRTACGRVKSVRLNGSEGSREISGERLRSELGLRSTYLTEIGIEPKKGKAQASPPTFLIKGRGFGHGLGLSQWGAYTLAGQGVTYQQILLFYYKNTLLARIQVR
jgi:stage II sporulation protein D